MRQNGGCCECGNEHSVPKMWDVSWLSEDLLVSQAALLHDIALIQQCRLLDGRKQFLAELTAVPSYYRMCSYVP